VGCSFLAGGEEGGNIPYFGAVDGNKRALQDQPSRGRKLRKYILPAFLICVPPLALLAFSRVKIIDDAYISYRYAYNIVEGQGLVFNTGERVEGYTNLLWTLMMTVPESLGLPVHLFAAFLGAAFGLLALIDTWRICNRLGVSSLGSTVATVALGLYPDFWLVVVNGLEGGLLAFLLMRSVYLVLSGRYTYAGLFCGLLFATRPDTLPVGVICALYALLASENQTLSLRQRLAHRAGPLLCAWLALVVAITVWGLSYYGACLPNTIAAKSVPPESLDAYQVVSNAYRGLEYSFSFALSAAPLTLGAVLGPGVGKGASRRLALPGALSCAGAGHMG
jgi:arabinofuranosyltransferase